VDQVVKLIGQVFLVELVIIRGHLAWTGDHGEEVGDHHHDEEEGEDECAKDGPRYVMLLTCCRRWILVQVPNSVQHRQPVHVYEG